MAVMNVPGRSSGGASVAAGAEASGLRGAAWVRGILTRTLELIGSSLDADAHHDRERAEQQRERRDVGELQVDDLGDPARAGAHVRGKRVVGRGGGGLVERVAEVAGP